MTLTLDITGPQAGTLGSGGRKAFHDAGGTIGRLPKNDVVLADSYVSATHAVIQYKGGVFYIEDRSTNGIFINSPDNRLEKGIPYALKSGDLILIEPYEIRASIGGTAQPAAPSTFDDLFPAFAPETSSMAHDLFDPLRAFEPPRPLSPPRPALPDNPLSSDDADPSPADVDWLGLLGNDPSRPVNRGLAQPPLSHKSVLNDHLPAPVEKASPAPPSPSHDTPIPHIPTNYDPLAPEDSPSVLQRPVVPQVPTSGNRSGPAAEGLPLRGRQTPSPSTAGAPQPGTRNESADGGYQVASERPRVRASAAGPDDVTLADILEGAGIRGVHVTPELARDFGRILRVVVSGLMEVLQARRHIKLEFRLGTTMFSPTGVNPLKMSVNVDDALHNLFVKQNPAYLSAVEAFQDGFADVRNHEMAMLEGIRVAFAAMMDEFKPDRLQGTFDEQVRTGALVAVPAKMRYWDLYRKKIDDLLKDPDLTFRTLFGEEFASAYEDQLKRLKGQKPREQS